MSISKLDPEFNTIFDLRNELMYQKQQHKIIVAKQKMPYSLGGTTYREVEESSNRILYLFNLFEIAEHGTK